MKYFGSTSYYNERGIIPNTNFRRLTARINADYTADEWLSSAAAYRWATPQKNGINEGQLMTAMLSRRPYFNLYYPDGTLAGVFQGQKSPLAQVKYTTDRTEYYQGNLYQGFELKLAKGLTFQTSINANLYLNKRQRVYPSMITDEWQKSNSGYAADNLNWNWLNENVLTYKNKWGNHNFSALVGFSEQQWRTDQTVMAGINSSTDFIPTMNAFAANLTLNETGTWQSNHSMASLFARVTYDFKAKYLIQATFRRDGSSRFSKGNRWGNFPSVSAAWRLSDENFMSFSRRALDDAKIRVSWGITGNEQIGNYDYLYSYATGDIYDGVGGVYPARLAVDNLRWEETRQIDVGLDLSFFDSRMTVTADYYDKYTDGLLANRELPRSPDSRPCGRTWRGQQPRFRVLDRGRPRSAGRTSGGTLRSTSPATGTRSNSSPTANPIWRATCGGYPRADRWATSTATADQHLPLRRVERLHARHVAAAHAGLRKRLRSATTRSTGRFTTADYVQKKLPNGKPFRGGDVNWEESAGSRNGVIDESDRMIIGNALSTYTGGLSTTITYKSVSLFVSFYYSFGGQIYNSAEHTRNMFQYNSTTPSPDVIYNIWTKLGDQALYPRPYNDEYNNARYANSFYVEDADYIRLSNIRLSYDLPERWVKSLRIKASKSTSSRNNPLTWTSYSGYDPEFSYLESRCKSAGHLPLSHETRIRSGFKR